MRNRFGVRSLVAVVASGGAGVAAGGVQPDDLSAYFGFGEQRIVVVDNDCGPVISADFNADGLPDLAIVNNAKSRIELHYLRSAARTDAEVERDLRPNALPPSPWYDKRDISVPQRVSALRAFDADGDQRLDLVYTGANPSEVVVLKQEGPETFRALTRQRVRGLSTRTGALAIADVAGDAAPELVTIAEDRILVFPMGPGGVLGEPQRLGSGGQFAAVFDEDYNGDGLRDLLAAIPDDAVPLRLWLQQQDPRTTAKSGLLSAELRFAMPALREVEPVRLPGRAAAAIGVIERASRRVVFYDLAEPAADGAPSRPGSRAEREVQAEARGFTDGSSKDRSVAVADLDGDGRLDLVATDAKANTVVVYRQARGIGLGAPEPFSALKQPKSIACGEWDGDAATPEVFVLSEEEKAVGISSYDRASGRLSFPTPLPIRTAGATPVAIGYARLGGSGAPAGGGALAVIVKQKRDHTLELHHAGGGSDGGAARVESVALEGVTRPPQSVLGADADQDGRVDLLLFTPGEPMIMVRATGDAAAPWKLLTDKDMPQFGLVQAAGPANTALLDADGDGKAELLIADRNFVRACRYDTGAGWRVVDQVTVRDPGTELVGLATLADATGGGPGTIAVADKGNERLLLIGRVDGAWDVRDRVRLMGVAAGPIAAGAFAGDDRNGILSLGEDAFALVRLEGARHTLEPFAAYRSDAKDRVEHEIECGDVNGDGYTDAVVLDAGEQMCQVLTFSAARKVLLATEFEVFQSRLFERGDRREFEPRDALVADVTGDGRDDIVLTVHDRVLIYPQAAGAE